MGEQSYLDALVVRTVTYRYRKRSFSFDLTQALFSSAAVDSGTHLLLSLLAEELELEDYDRIVDLGSGTGTLGISLAGSTGVPLEALDRDACATAFTRRNAAGNGLQDASIRTDLLLPEYPGEGRELVVSNLPAKAGGPVLRLLIEQITRRAALSGGESALVVVKPLADTLASILDELGAESVAERRTANHAAVIYRCTRPTTHAPEREPLPPAFVRTRAGFQGPVRPYQLDTVHNLPEFDGLAFRTALAFDLMRSTKVSGPALVLGCGQGHIPVGLLQRAGKEFELLLADRDLLALRATGHNLESHGAQADRTLVVPAPAALTEHLEPDSLEWLVVNDDPVPGSEWNQEVLSAAGRLLRPEGKLLVVARSTTVSRLQRAAGGRLSQVAERRMHGFRASLLRFRR